jgi:hypothetical protein
MPTYAYPTYANLSRIDPTYLDAETLNDPVLGPGGIFPIEQTDADMLIWEQRDNYFGLMQFRGLNGEPPRVKRIGAKRVKMEPGYYGEYTEVPEDEMTRRAQPATWNAPIPITDLVAECQTQLVVRQTVRMRYLVWTLLVSGAFAVLDKDGTLAHADAFPLQTFTATVPWATVATATPLADLRGLPLLVRGQSLMFGGAATAWMNRKTFNYMLSNQNANDLRGERLDNNRTVQSLADANLVFTRNDLPNVRIYEDGYYDDAGAWQLFIPDNKVVVTGSRTNGAAIGAFMMTKNLAAPNGIGVAVKVVEKGMADDQMPPPRIDVFRGFHGGVVVYFPGAIFLMNV